ncbi:YdcF family protein [Shewanella livingstonensis]|uniref:YdcF family protein n=1 Tax=Shewanella livingstonensis TaxID=150120 RepID=A0A3G8LW87_9GAMM|nr:ElyC/SanA/YdcF family protein [Shewanella livingstonensis]AZG73899.1 YdcF family protein [Shewanella livingstonensis]
MFWLKKILSQLVMPIPASIMLLVIAAILWRTNKLMLLRCGRIALVTAITLLVLTSQTQVSYFLADSLESQYQVNHQPITGTCVVMVLGSGNREQQGHTAVQQLSSTALARLTEGVRQFSLGQNCTLVVSGWSGGNQPTAHATIMALAAQELGIPTASLVVFNHPKDTIEEAYALKNIVGYDPFRLVTSATHMPRSMAIFSALGMQPQPAPSDFIANRGDWWRLDADQLLTSQRSIHEYVGILWLQIKGLSH